MTDTPFTFEVGDDPIVATAIHAGHGLRDEVADLMLLPEDGRLREEDPFTERWVGVAANRVIAHRSRFEFDLNRSPEKAVYRVPDDCWGLDVWKTEPPEDLVARSLAIHESYYAELAELCDRIIEAHGHVVVLDIHSYNHRRSGPNAAVDDPEANPEIIIGTAGISPGWDNVVDALSSALAARPLTYAEPDVRFDVKFTGGNQVRWLKGRYGDRCCAFAIEFKKVYMDEWTGEADEQVIEAISELMASATAALRGALAERARSH
ncbi:MAG: N-formylglutamate amidohydrolase [Acidimicrobiales bacterium]|nr:N-formylglutamate amidohydrolase [Acidimicrobiales bacterium]RZV46456.1 MAG: N-formylglutamate amidohydrolase [Acidimicrobiales bacterium]